MNTRMPFIIPFNISPPFVEELSPSSFEMLSTPESTEEKKQEERKEEEKWKGRTKKIH